MTPRRIEPRFPAREESNIVQDIPSKSIYLIVYIHRQFTSPLTLRSFSVCGKLPKALNEKRIVFFLLPHCCRRSMAREYACVIG